MTFFNRKEEVVQIELTRVGRQKLALGEFKPTHYEFLDEDILYDRKNFSSDVVEDQNSIKKRIKEKLSLRIQTAKQSVPVQSGSYLPQNRLIESMGTFIPYSNYRPAWNLTAEDGVIFSGSGELDFVSVEAASSSGLFKGPSYEKIPQLSLVCEYNYNLGTILNDGAKDFNFSLNENPILERNDVLKNPDDDTYILFKKDFNDFTISVEEENVLNEKDGFEIEFFKYEYTEDKQGKQKINVKQLFVDDSDENSANWYFDITTDDLVKPAREGFTFIDEEIELKVDDDECVDL
tara:strand:+ start:130 stop:1005 length:876 start_codon:yes stop_codon:yes gene_type:complete